uniref:YoaK family protein n=1 Tax=Abiotrophia defectiva TaxID=46125 RepID=UPI0026EE7838
NLSQLVLALARGDGEATSRLALTLLAFIAGSILSGLLFSDKAFRLGNRYGVLLISFGLLLGLSYVLNWQASWLYLLAFGMGTQNGMFIYYRGMIVRSSHFTGYLTDTGFALGRYLRGYKEDGHKIIFYMASIACFLVGGLLTYIWLNHSAISMILVLALAYLVTGTYYFILRHCHQAD